MRRMGLSLAMLAGLGACEYSPPEDSGLIGVRPIPTAGDVCQIIGENELTAEYLDDSATLIGCPNHERGAIADRKRGGAVEVGTVGRWVLLSQPHTGPLTPSE
ncbi:MAG: hypothetical protein MK098_09735 [Marinovum sp.]|nr:hypothetical protein [Marinovum sp.]